MFTVYIMRSIFVIYIGVAGLKPKSVIYNHFIPSFSAALLFAAGALWLLLAFAIEHFEQDNSEKIECSVSAYCDSETTPSQKCVSIRSTKIPSYSSTRRFESVVPAPFLFLSVKKNILRCRNCGKNHPCHAGCCEPCKLCQSRTNWTVCLTDFLQIFISFNFSGEKNAYSNAGNGRIGDIHLRHEDNE